MLLMMRNLNFKQHFEGIKRIQPKSQLSYTDTVRV